MSMKLDSEQKMPNTFKGKEEDNKKTFKETLKELADSSSLHGVPKIVASRQVPVKVLWCLLFIATCSLLGYQLNGLFETYYSYPVQTTIQLDFNAINFPAISLCNMNPVMLSKLNKSEELKALFEKNLSSTSQQINSSPSPPSSSSLSPQSSSPSPQSSSPSPQSSSSSPPPSSSSSPQSSSSSPQSSSLSPPPSSSPSQASSSSSPPPSSSPSQPSSSSSPPPSSSPSQQSSSSSSPQSSSSSSPQSSSKTLPRLSSSSVTSAESLPSSYPSSTGLYPDDDHDDNYYSYEDYNDDNYYHNDWDYYADPDNYIEQQLNGNTDEWAERVNQFREVVKALPLDQRHKVGHQIDRFIMSTYFAGSEVKIKKYNNFTSSLYGNCYTLSSKQYVAWRSGPANGIKITLNLETDEYISKFSTGYGARLVLHDPGTYPLPFNEGITLSPGTETSVGLKMVRISRLGQPYGDCTSGDDFARRYRKKYSVAACDHFCRVKKAMDNCKCIPTDAPDQITLNTTVLPVCNTSNKIDQECLLEIDVSFRRTSPCDCKGPCKETLFEKTISSRYWPTSEYSKHLLLTMCKELEKEGEELNDACVSILESDYYGYSLTTEEFEKLRRNFLRVLIYFEDLNFEKISQEPLYQGIRFLSDIGGTMGLFLGASFLSLVEVLQFLLEIILHIKKKITSRKSVTP